MAVKRTSAEAKSPRVFGQARKPAKMFRAGISKAEIARRLQIGRTSVRRILE